MRRACRHTRGRSPREKRYWNERKDGSLRRKTTTMMTMSITSAFGLRMLAGPAASRGSDRPTPSRWERVSEFRSPFCLQILPTLCRGARIDTCTVTCRYSVTLQLMDLCCARFAFPSSSFPTRLLSPDTLAIRMLYAAQTLLHRIRARMGPPRGAAVIQELRGLLKRHMRLHEPLSIGRTTNGLCPSAWELLHARCGDPRAQTPPCPCSYVSFVLGPRSLVCSRTYADAVFHRFLSLLLLLTPCDSTLRLCLPMLTSISALFDRQGAIRLGEDDHTEGNEKLSLPTRLPATTEPSVECSRT